MARFLGDSISNSFLSTVNRGLFAVRGCPRNSCVSRESQNSREKYPRRPTPFILSMRSTIIRISLRSRPSGTLDLIDNLVKCAKRNIFFACLMRVGRYYKPRVYCDEKRGREESQGISRSRRMHPDERTCHAHHVRTVEEEWKNGGPR